MTGRYAFQLVRSQLATAGKRPARLAPDVFMDTLNAAMREVNRRLPVYVARDISLAVSATTGRNFRVKVGGRYLTVQGIIRASCAPTGSRAYPVRPEPPFQFDGPEATGATVATGRPEHIWVEPDDFGGFSTAVVSNQVWGVYPKPDADYTVHAVCWMPLADYSDWSSEMPVQARAHDAVVAVALGDLFSQRSFHDNAMKGVWLQRAEEKILALQTPTRLVIDLPVPGGEEVYEVEGL